MACKKTVERTMRGFTWRAKRAVKRGESVWAKEYARAAARLYYQLYGRNLCDVCQRVDEGTRPKSGTLYEVFAEV